MVMLDGERPDQIGRWFEVAEFDEFATRLAPQQEYGTGAGRYPCRSVDVGQCGWLAFTTGAAFGLMVQHENVDAFDECELDRPVHVPGDLVVGESNGRVFQRVDNDQIA